MFYFFFFQAEDGIRDYKVTGVQTCALPICGRRRGRSARHQPDRDRCRGRPDAARPAQLLRRAAQTRSEERRVGKECRSRGWPDRQKKKKSRKDREGTGETQGRRRQCEVERS